MSTSAEIKGKDGIFAVMKTSKGDIVCKLFYKETPLTVTNFVGLAEGNLDVTDGESFYDGLLFHRVIEDFMIQGGDPEGTGRGGPGYKFADECKDDLVFDAPGKLAMANAGPGTNGSQFFITHVPTPWLNGKHTIFGEVVEGQDVVNAIKQNDKIIKITIIRQGKEAESFKCEQSDFNALSAKVAEDEKAEKEKKYISIIKKIQKKFPNVQKNENGIFYEINKVGTGSKTGANRAVSVEYKGYFLNGDVFDTSVGRAPLDFTTAAKQMIPGFDIMVQDMQLNENRTIILPPEFAYGARGVPGVIPENSFICFDVELLKN
ncbi:MAG: peptidylprolyl isomerase [Treponema sp. CETP13]|nr:MAG: peptidylprolyl isomerase [Treponema sp. CETP13]